MTREQFKSRATTLQMLKVQSELIKQQIEAIETEIKSEMSATGENLVDDEDFRFRYTDVISRNLDQRRLKEEHPELYAEYSTERNCKRFTFTVFA